MTASGAGGAGKMRVGDIKAVPQEAELRERIRLEADRAAATVGRDRPLGRTELEELAGAALGRLGLDGCYLGFAMVAVSNAFWREQFASVPFSRRLLLLPYCLRDVPACAGSFDSLGLACARCGACALCELQGQAESLGYKVLIAEGTPAVVQIALSGRRDAIIGVACLDSLEEAFARVVELGMPHAAVPLLCNGCAGTVAELDLIRTWMHLRSGPAPVRTRSYVGLLRTAEALFEADELEALLAGQLAVAGAGEPGAEQRVAELAPLAATEAIAFEWLRHGGKRFRPFITLASFAALAYGRDALMPGADLSRSFPASVKRVALAIEAFHKASLVHDDIADGDSHRYGRKTLHLRYGLPTALNVGDYLVGLGYRLIASTGEDLGADCTGAILARLSDAHVKLCRGQGAELIWREREPRSMRPGDAQAVYGLKTAPAFEAAMYAGIRMAGAGIPEGGKAACDCALLDPGALLSFSRYLGTAYQVLNDLNDWEGDSGNKVVAGQDCLSARPTILRAFALAAGDEASNRELLDIVASDVTEDERIRLMREVYQARGVFEKARQLVRKYRTRALAEADRMASDDLRELMHFVVATAL
ncbi:MAG: polyprenyl synthetase family protein [Candidatus Brocadiia bacterium]|nr:polyprenyl synthetase family protein [Candidatus Brocadiia bacterium]